MIVSGRLGQDIVPSIHELRQVISIYVYCMDKSRHEQWARNFAKVKAVIVELNELISRIETDHRMHKIVEEPLSINIFTTSTNAGTSTMGVNESNKKDKEELIHLCKQEYKENDAELSYIDEFENTYSSDQVLWWYTRQSFFYKTLNAALRKQDIQLIFLFREIISHMCYQLKNNQVKDSLQLYRGQMMSSDELKTLKQCLDQFISVNSFFSTSMDKQQALFFLNNSSTTENLEPVLFEIDADPTMATTKPFADISPFSEFPRESEILFMLGSIFRLKSIHRSGDSQVWVIRMVLCSDNEHELKHVLMDMKQQFGSGKMDLRTLGTLLSEMSKFDLAEKYFIRLLEQLPLDDPLLYDLYQDLGKFASQAGNFDKCMEWRQKAIGLKQQVELAGKQSY
ncbi:unnamed protein product [Rotaria sp. Silwood1]|nr:unnamed protein product [Rotaria sp. Silwood1]CAF1532443.1 unnamed protein product [Rotaria sp. Silwood1]CAF1565027.1 unnamed protein product [Rotaria sp. Silwood1]CAF3617198.1 unnamed protein product [Rotaria sp. Silwood1]